MDDAIALRPAGIGDQFALAALLVQLYAAELPGALSGPPAGQRALLRYTLQADGFAGLGGRYLALDASGQVVGTAGARLSSDPQVNRAPGGTLRMALTLLGWRHTARLAATLARTMLLPAPPLPPGYAYIHGVTVAAERRGQGWGTRIMRALEEQLAAQGAIGAQLQVLRENHGARRLYQRLGYRVSGETPAWMARLTFPTDTLIRPF